MKLNNGPISQDDLMLRLANAKKVMEKVDDGNYHKGNINEAPIVNDDEAYAIADQLRTDDETVPLKDVGTVNISKMQEEKINQSNLPEHIKQAMINNPTQLSLNDSLDMNFVERTKKIMEQQGVSTKKTNNTQPRTNNPPQSLNSNDIVSQLTPIIENIVLKTMNDIFDKKLDLILNAQKTSTINENLVLKVGESIFSGKITGVKKSK